MFLVMAMVWNLLYVRKDKASTVLRNIVIAEPVERRLLVMVVKGLEATGAAEAFAVVYVVPGFWISIAVGVGVSELRRFMFADESSLEIRNMKDTTLERSEERVRERSTGGFVGGLGSNMAIYTHVNATCGGVRRGVVQPDVGVIRIMELLSARVQMARQVPGSKNASTTLNGPMGRSSLVNLRAYKQ